MSPTKVAIISGASRGIGRSLALALAARGYQVGLLARDRDLLESAANEILATGGKATFAICDVCDLNSVLHAVKKIESEFGPADLVIANAGISMTCPASSLSSEPLRKVLDTNVFGVIHLFEAVIPKMLAAGKGHLVVISSLASYFGVPGQAAYCGSKAAVSRMMESFRFELAPRGIAVSCICPGFIETDMTAGQNGMILLMDLSSATSRIMDGIDRKVAVLNFPRRLYWLIRLARLLPDWLIRWSRLMPGL